MRLQEVNCVSVAILSGRSLDDLQDRIQVPGIALAGDHGLKVQLPDGSKHYLAEKPSRNIFRSLIAEVDEAVDHIPNIQIELKEFSLTIHFRGASEKRGAELEDILGRIVESTPYRLQPGRMCWEINPDVDCGKGKAFDWIKERLTGNKSNLFQLYIGDDRTDEDVFRIMPDSGISVLVVSAEIKSRTHAEYRLNSQQDTVEFIEKLTAYLSGQTGIS